MRYLALPFIFASLLAGMLGGLWKAGWTVPAIAPAGMAHGALMTGSFLGSLISLERAVVVKKWYAFLVPLLGALSLFVFFIDPHYAMLLLYTASLGFVVIMSFLYLRYKEWHHLIMIAGAGCWAVGNVLVFLRGNYFIAVPWWMLFFLFTITAERMELARFLLLKTSRVRWIVFFLALAFAGVLVPFHEWGQEIFGAGLAFVAVALVRFDMARKSAKGSGIHRYSGYALLAGYAWLLVSGLAMIIFPFSGLIYDGILHAFFIGFVFSMIFAHGPMILPTVLKLGTFFFHRILWVWAMALHAGLLLRFCGDLHGDALLRLIGAWANAAAILGFFVSMGTLLLYGQAQKKRWKGTAL